MPDTVAERPTFAQAFAADAASAADPAPASPAPETPAASEPAAATALPADPSTARTTPDATPAGEPPQERWPTILENARTKAKQETQALFDRDYGWAKSIPKETMQEWTGIANRMATDPIGFLSELQRQIEAHPTFGPQLRSHAARTLASGRSTAPDLRPDLVVDDGQGHQIATFSAERVQQIVAQTVAEALQKEITPIKQDFESRQQAERQATQQRQIDQRSDSIYDRASQSLKGFKEHEAAIAAVMETLSDEFDPGEALYEAWAQVVLPKLDAHAKAEHLESLQTKAAANTVKPGAAISTTKRPTSFHDRNLQWG